MEAARECILHFDKQHVRTLRSYAKIFEKEKTDTKPKLIRLLEWLTNSASSDWQKKAFERSARGETVENEPEHWVEASYKWFQAQFYGFISEDTIKKHLEELVKEGWIKRRANPTYGPPLYWLNCRRIQKELRKQWEQMERERIRRGASIEDVQWCDESPDESDEQYDDSSERETPQGGVKFTPSPQNTPLPRNLPPGRKLPPRGEKQGEVGNLSPGGKKHPREGVNLPPGRGEISGEGGVKFTPPIRISISNNKTDRDSSSPESQQNTDNSDDETEEGEEEIIPLSEKNDQDSDDIDPTEKHSIVSRNGASSTIEPVTQASKRQSVIPARPKAPTSGQPTVEEAKHLFDARCQKLLERIAVWRGYVLDSSQGAIYTELQNVKRLIAAYPDDADIEFGHLYLSCWHPQYRGTQPDFRYAQLLLDEIPNALNWRAKTLSSATSAADPPVIPARPKPAQQQQQANDPPDDLYSLANFRALQNGGGRLS